MLVGLGTLLHSGINKLLSTLFGNLWDIMPDFTSLRPLNCTLKGYLTCPLCQAVCSQHLTCCFTLFTCSTVCYWNYRLSPSPSEPAEKSCAGFLPGVGCAETLHTVCTSLVAFTGVSCKSWPSWISSFHAKIILPLFSPAAHSAQKQQKVCVWFQRALTISRRGGVRHGSVCTVPLHWVVLLQSVIKNIFV